MRVKGVEKPGERINIVDDFSILIPYGWCYEIDENASGKDPFFILFKPSSLPERYQKGVFDLNDEELDCEVAFSFKYTGSVKVAEDATDMGIDFESVMKNMYDKADSLSLNISLDEESSDQGFRHIYKIIKDEPFIKVGYYTHGFLGKTNYNMIIISSHNICLATNCSFDSNDYAKNEEELQTIFGSINPLNVKIYQDVEEQPAFVKPLYDNTTGTNLGPVTVMLPDDFMSISISHIPENDLSSIPLLKDYVLVAAPVGCKGGLNNFRDASLGINIAKPEHTGLNDNSWKNPDNIKKGLNSYFDGREITIIREGEKYLIGYGKGNECENNNEPYWVIYFIVIFCGSLQYTCNLYFNSEKADPEEYVQVIEEFCNKIQINNDAINKAESELLKQKLGDMLADNGKLDGVFATKLYSKDVVFNNDSEVTYDGKHTNITGFQLNSDVMDNYPQIVNNAITVLKELKEVISFVEQNENLMIPKKRIHPEILKATRNNPITGATIFELCAWHMLLIAETEDNKYTVVIDNNLIKGIPDAFSFIGEFIKTLRAYNERNDDFEVSFASTLNADGPCGNIDAPVRGAVLKSSHTISIKGGEPDGSSNYASILKEMDSVSDEEYYKAEISKIEETVGPDVSAELKAEAKDAKELFAKIASAINAKNYEGLNDIDEVAQRIDEAVNESIDIMAFNITHMYQSLSNSYEILYLAQKVCSDKPTAFVQMNITENAFVDGSSDSNELPEKLYKHLRNLSEEEIYRRLLESAALIINHGNRVISKKSAEFLQKKINELGNSFEVQGTRYEGRIERVESLKVNEKLELLREPDNPYDHNAIDLISDFGSVGHLPAKIAELLSPALDEGKITAIAEVTKVVPLSERSAKAKNPLLVVKLIISDNNNDNQKESNEDNAHNMETNNENKMISINNINFYMNNEVNSWLFNKFKSSGESEVFFVPGDSFSYDIIEQPFHCEFNSSDDANTIRFYIRSDFGIYPEDTANIEVTRPKNGGEPSVKNRGGLGGDVAEVILQFFVSGGQLRKEIINQNLINELSDFDPEKEGVIVRLDEDELLFERVSGRKRPSMMCNSIFEGMHMGRPYTDELTSGFMREGLSIDEKVTLAEDGDEDCMEDVALTYLNGDDEVEQDFEKSAYWWEKLAEAGNSQAQFNMGLFYAKGCGVTRDFEKAAEWMKKALENGDDDAKAPYEAYIKAAENLEKAEAGDVNAQAEIAKLYTKIGGSLEQYGPGDDYKAALKWAKKAADQGNADALWTLALAYEHGRGVDEDKDKAIELYSKGAEQNNPDAMNSLGACILRGEVPGKTSKDAFELIKRAAEMGNVLAMRNLGHCYQFEEGTDYDMKKAIFWYEKYLEHEYDEELAQKVMIFKSLEDIDEEIDETLDDWTPPEGYEEALENFSKYDQSEQIDDLTGKENKNNKYNKKNGFDDKMTFDLPRKYELVESKDDDGKPEYKICYNISLDADGNKQAEKSYTLKKYEKEKTLVGNVESNFNVGVDGFSKDFNIGLNISSSGLRGSGRTSQITYKVYSGVAIIEYEDKWYTILTTHVGTDDYESRSNAAEDIASELTTVLGFIIIDGERLKIEPITKSFMINKLKTEGMDDINTLPLSPEEEDERLERKKREEEEKQEQEKKAQEAKKEKERLREEAQRKKKEEQEKKQQEENKRNEEVRKRVDQKKKLIMTFANIVCPKLINNNQMILQVQESEKNAAEAKLEALGFFKISQKQEQRAIIETCQRTIDNIKAANINIDVITKIGAKMAEELAEEDQEYQAALVDQLIPGENSASAHKSVFLTSTQKENEEAKKTIIDILNRSQKPMTVKEITQSDCSLSNFTYHRIINVLGDLKTEGLVRSQRDSNKHEIVYVILDKPDFDLNLPTYDVMDVDLEDSEAVKNAIKMDLDFLLRQWKYDSRERLGICAQNINQPDIVDTCQMRLDILRFFKLHEGQNLQTLKSDAGQSLKDNRGNILALSSACEDDLVKKNYLVPFYRKEGIETSSITDKGKLLLAMYGLFYER